MGRRTAGESVDRLTFILGRALQERGNGAYSNEVVDTVYKEALRRLLAKQVQEQDAQDCALKIATTAFAKLVSGGGSPRRTFVRDINYWINLRVSSEVKDRWRQRQGRPEEVDYREDGAKWDVDKSPLAEEIFVSTDYAEWVVEQLSLLRPGVGEIARLRIMQGMEWREIGLSVGKTDSHCRVLFHQAKSILRALWERCYNDA